MTSNSQPSSLRMISSWSFGSRGSCHAGDGDQLGTTPGTRQLDLAPARRLHRTQLLCHCKLVGRVCGKPLAA